MDVGIYLGWGIAAAFIGSIIFLTWRSVRQIRVRRAVKAYIEAQTQGMSGIQLFDQWDIRYVLEVTGKGKIDSGPCMFTLSDAGVTLYPIKLPVESTFGFELEQLRWFGRPEAYHAGQNEVWLHVERKRDWVVVKLWLGRTHMMDFIRALKPLVDPELVIAYRRRRPYMHYGPVTGQPAEQDIHGAWTLAAPVSLYVMPRYLLILHDDAVQQVIPLAAVQQIGALPRLDAPQADGLVRFQTAEAPYAFSLKPYETFANALAEAAKRTLEAPVMQKQKSSDGEWDDVD